MGLVKEQPCVQNSASLQLSLHRAQPRNRAKAGRCPCLEEDTVHSRGTHWTLSFILTLHKFLTSSWKQHARVRGEGSSCIRLTTISDCKERRKLSLPSDGHQSSLSSHSRIDIPKDSHEQSTYSLDKLRVDLGTVQSVWRVVRKACHLPTKGYIMVIILQERLPCN